MLSIQLSRERMLNHVDKNLGLIWDEWLTNDKMTLSAFEIAWSPCLSYLTLQLCLAFTHSLGTKSFYLDLSWTFIISSVLVFAFTWLWAPEWYFLSLLSNLRLCALMSVNAFIKGDIEIPSWEVPWSHPCEINDWHKSKRTCSTAMKLALRQSEVVKSLGPFNTLRKMLAGFMYPWGYSGCVLHVGTFWSFDRCLVGV
jgi:hypothetical protein